MVCFKKKKKKISEVSEFSILPYTQNRKLGNLRICLFLQILRVVVNQDLKTTKIWTKKKTERFQYDLKEKIKIFDISKFLILLYTQDRKLKNLGNLTFILNFDSSCNSRLESNRKNELKQKLKVYNFWKISEMFFISNFDTGCN